MLTYQAQIYATARASLLSTNSSEGIEYVETKPFTHVEKVGDTTIEREGIYTHRIYHLGSYMPGWLRAIVPASALKLEEKAWDAFPYCKTVLTHNTLGDKFEFVIESRHTEGEYGKEENILGLEGKNLEKREVRYIDIAMDKLDKKNYRKDEDPTLFQSKKMPEYGPLKKGWQDEAKKIMCCYKLVSIKVKIFGIQTRIERFVTEFEKDVFLRFHKQLYCWVDDWYGKSMKEIREYEAKTLKQMNDTLNLDEVEKNRGKSKEETKEEESDEKKDSESKSSSSRSSSSSSDSD